MHRTATMFFGLAALLFASAVASQPAKAGEYYHGAYGYRGAVAYSSNCCYRKVVRYVRKVSYVRVDDGHREGYYAPRHHSSYYDGSPYRQTVYSEPYRYDGGYDGYRAYRVSYGDNCTVRRVRVADGYGGWVWASSRVCY